MKILSKSLSETKSAAKSVLRKIKRRPRGAAAVVGLYGNLGSGKTTFVQCTAKLLGVSQNVLSPTFVIIKSYQLPITDYKLLIHIDAYRLENGSDLAKLGFVELLEDPGNLIIIEWADKVEDILPKNCLKIGFKFIDENTREIVF